MNCPRIFERRKSFWTEDRFDRFSVRHYRRRNMLLGVARGSSDQTRRAWVLRNMWRLQQRKAHR